MADFSASTYALCMSQLKQVTLGLGITKGAPATVKSIVPTYSDVDPTVIVGNTITLEWTANDGSKKQSSFFTVDHGRGMAKIDYQYSDTQYYYYEITYYDGSTEPMQIPVSSGQLKRRIVPNIPNADSADDSTFYLVPIPGKTGSYSQYIRVSTGSVSNPWEMLFIGTTDVDLQDLKHQFLL